MILMLDVLNELTLITININLFLNNNDAQLEKNKFEKNIINSINLENNNYLITI